MKRFAVIPLLFLVSCSRQATPPAAELPRATVVMRDGTRVAGAVAASTPAEITINLDNGGSQTIPMKNVSRVDYGETAAADPVPAAAQTPTPAPVAQTPAASTPRKAAPAPSTPAPAPVAPAREEREHAKAAAIQSITRVLEAGTEIPVRAGETIDSAKAVEGQVYTADIAGDVKDAHGDVVIPRGSNAEIVIKSVSKGGKIKGASDLVVDLKSVSIGGRQYALETAEIAQKGRDGVGVNKRTGMITGGGAAIGAIVGAIAGGGKGAAIGAGAGAGAGALTQTLTRGSIKIPVETVLTFKLDGPLRVVESR